MRPVKKFLQSKVIEQNLQYKLDGDNSTLRKALLEEQFYLCAYTETYLGRTDQKDIDHFNPTLKGKPEDTYENWFLCKAQWNKEKGAKWEKFQPVLHPTDESIESRIVYYDGNYVLDNQDDLEAKHLIHLLKLDDPDLADNRRRYIKRLKQDAERYGENMETHIRNLLKSNPERVYFIRAIKEEFGLENITELLEEAGH